MKLSSSIKFDLLMLPILFIFFYDLPIASGSISGKKLRIRRSVLAHQVISILHTYWMRTPAVTGVAAGSARVVVEKKMKNICIISESSLIDDESFIFY